MQLIDGSLDSYLLIAWSDYLLLEKVMYWGMFFSKSNLFSITMGMFLSSVWLSVNHVWCFMSYQGISVCGYLMTEENSLEFYIEALLLALMYKGKLLLASSSYFSKNFFCQLHFCVLIAGDYAYVSHSISRMAFSSDITILIRLR